MSHRLALLTLVLVSALPALALDQPALAIDEKDIAYASRDGKPLLLDLHVPAGQGPFPAAVLIHGGGFDAGSKSTNVRPLFEPLAQNGFAWFSLDYRLAPAAHFEQALRDIQDGIAWVKSNAPKYRLDPSKFVIIGESAGGLFVNYLGTHTTGSVSIAAVVDFYGASDYAQLARDRGAHPERFDMTTINRHAANGGGIHFFGVQQLDAAGLARLQAVAPLASVHSGMPPFLCLHGTKDDQVPYEQATVFCEAIRHAGSRCDLITIENGAHGMSRWSQPDMLHWQPEMIAWLKKTLQVSGS